uniref:Cytidyltransferase-like domain-containing protein n=1 Tax=Fabrea salina TaxID=342563 RepID=A0A7S3MTV4_9CILI|mmetsp:Transcript_1661/g.2697  ORF Transcript_1661/g.2697 Transcript_1661/m.2697 type:complete len:287 (+) Transcript_1661:42-902(+)
MENFRVVTNSFQVLSFLQESRILGILPLGNLSKFREKTISKVVNQEGLQEYISSPIASFSIGETIRIETDTCSKSKLADPSKSLKQNLEDTWSFPEEFQVYSIDSLFSGFCTNTLYYSKSTIRNFRPSKCLILPGSFNPFHYGHENLLKAAQAHYPSHFAIYELSISNYEKPTIPKETLLERLKQFSEPILVTKHARFIEKSRLGKNNVFVLGYDTATRLLQESYEVLGEIKARGHKFLVAGRLVSGKFQQLHKENLPETLQSIFEELPNFREDISSTEIRQGLIP